MRRAAEAEAEAPRHSRKSSHQRRRGQQREQPPLLTASSMRLLAKPLAAAAQLLLVAHVVDATTAAAGSSSSAAAWPHSVQPFFISALNTNLTPADAHYLGRLPVVVINHKQGLRSSSRGTRAEARQLYALSQVCLPLYINTCTRTIAPAPAHTNCHAAGSPGVTTNHIFPCLPLPPSLAPCLRPRPHLAPGGGGRHRR